MTPKLAHLPFGQNDHRLAERYDCAVPTTCQPPSAWCKEPWPAVIRNISTGGLSLTLNRRFEPGSGLAIELPGEDGTTATILAKVVHVHPQDEGWLLGCDFISELSEEEVQLVLNLDPVSHASLSSGEEAPDESLPSIQGVLFQAAIRPGEMLRWYVKRLDLAGTWPLQRGQFISLRVGGLSDKTPPIEMNVCECRRFGSYWIVETSLCELPADPVLRVLMATPSC